MQARMTNPAYLVPDAGQAIQALFQATRHDMEDGVIAPATLMPAAMRGSQVNGGSACLYADVAEARKAGVTDDQLTSVAAWRQSPFFTDAERAASLPGGFRSAHAHVNGIRLHYVTGGKGEPLVLLPGWPATWWSYHKVMPALTRRYRVIAVDIRGMGASDEPAGGFDKKTMARDIYELVRTLGHDGVNIAGHDIGAMVAFSFAADHPAATRELALLDVLHPDESLHQIRCFSGQAATRTCGGGHSTRSRAYRNNSSRTDHGS